MFFFQTVGRSSHNNDMVQTRIKTGHESIDAGVCRYLLRLKLLIAL